MGRSAFLTVVSSSFGVVAGVVLDAIVVAIFGMGRQTDAYYIASTIPLAISNLLVFQAVQVAQPIFIRKRTTEGEPRAWAYLNLYMTTGALIVSATCGGGVLLSALLMRVQFAGASAVTIQTATQLSMLFFVILPLHFPINVLRAALNSHGSFAVPAAMKFFENICKILFVLLFWRQLGLLALVVGMLAGALIQLLVSYLMLRRKGFRFTPILGLRHPDMTQAYGLVGVQVTGSLAGTGVDVISNTLGSALGAGNVTALRLAARLIDSVGAILQSSVVSASIPAISSSIARNDLPATRQHFRRAVYLVFLVSLPMSVWFGLMSRPVVAFLYERARFSSADANLVSNLLLLMIPHFLFGRFRNLFEVFFFANQNTLIPVLAALTEAALYVAGSLCLVSLMGIYALPTARIFGGVLGSALLAYMVMRRIGALGLRALRGPLGRLCAASAIMALTIVVGSRLSVALPVGPLGMSIVNVVVPSGLGLTALAISLVALGSIDLSLARGGLWRV